MSRTRLRQVLQYNLYPNLLAIDSFPRPEGSHDLDYVRFPVNLGILGYRICFVSPKQQQAVARVQALRPAAVQPWARPRLAGCRHTAQGRFQGTGG